MYHTRAKGFLKISFPTFYAVLLFICTDLRDASLQTHKSDGDFRRQPQQWSEADDANLAGAALLCCLLGGVRMRGGLR
jgi:hypothetical protein